VTATHSVTRTLAVVLASGYSPAVSPRPAPGLPPLADERLRCEGPHLADDHRLHRACAHNQRRLRLLPRRHRRRAGVGTPGTPVASSSPAQPTPARSSTFASPCPSADHRRPPLRTVGRSVSVERKCQLAAGLDTELREHLVQVVLDLPGGFNAPITVRCDAENVTLLERDGARRRRCVDDL
jgi:hypothetical protein